MYMSHPRDLAGGHQDPGGAVPVADPDPPAGHTSRGQGAVVSA